MSACATPSGLVRAPFGNPPFQAENIRSCFLPDCDGLGRARQIRQVFKRAGLTASGASCLTGVRYGKNTPYYVPPTLLYKTRIGITPHVCQLVALSEVSGYPFVEWMKLYGFDLTLILPLQLEVHTERTAMITPAHKFSAHDFSRVQADSRIGKSDSYFFAKVGTGDNVLYPKLLPGSVVRADRRYSPQVCSTDRSDELLWLVEHPGGLACCHVKRIDSEHVVLLPNRPPLSAWPLRLSREVRVLGLIDMELRPGQVQQFGSTYRQVRTDTLATIPRCTDRMSISNLLRISRVRHGLTLRAAHQKTVRVAQLLQNADYRIPLGLLSDYEATDRFPRHIAKIISLCVVYGIDFWELMRAGGSEIIDDCRKAPVSFLSKSEPASGRGTEPFG
jgi:hypothetical protein